MRGLRSREQKLLSSVARFLLLSEKRLEMTQNKELGRRFWQTEWVEASELPSILGSWAYRWTLMRGLFTKEGRGCDFPTEQVPFPHSVIFWSFEVEADNSARWTMWRSRHSEGQLAKVWVSHVVPAGLSWFEQSHSVLSCCNIAQRLHQLLESLPHSFPQKALPD